MHAVLKLGKATHDTTKHVQWIPSSRVYNSSTARGKKVSPCPAKLSLCCWSKRRKLGQWRLRSASRLVFLNNLVNISALKYVIVINIYSISYTFCRLVGLARVLCVIVHWTIYNPRSMINDSWRCGDIRMVKPVILITSLEGSCCPIFMKVRSDFNRFSRLDITPAG